MMIMTWLTMLVIMLKVVLRVWWEVVKELNQEGEKLTHFRSDGGGADAFQVLKRLTLSNLLLCFSLCVEKSITKLSCKEF